ncbi:hypothetical protein P8452_31148 [Trifolium repens]|nr:hypothetical protein P8452_31148 [Trifolium repens]
MFKQEFTNSTLLFVLLSELGYNFYLEDKALALVLKSPVVGGPISCKLELALGKLHINMLFLETHGLKKLPQLHIRIYMFCCTCQSL